LQQIHLFLLFVYMGTQLFGLLFCQAARLAGALGDVHGRGLVQGGFIGRRLGLQLLVLFAQLHF